MNEKQVNVDGNKDLLVRTTLVIGVIIIIISMVLTTIYNRGNLNTVESQIESKYPITYKYLTNTTHKGPFKTYRVVGYNGNIFSNTILNTLGLETDENKMSIISSDVTLKQDDDIVLEPQTITTKQLIDMDNELGKRDIKIKTQSVNFSIGYKTVTLLDTNNIVWTITTDNQNTNDEHTIIIK